MELMIDLHCHPSLKPFSRSVNFGNRNSSDPKKKYSIWYNDPPSFFDRILNRTITVTKFSQSDFTALYRGSFRVVVVALYPVEKGFFVSRTGIDFLDDWISNFITEVGKDKVDCIQSRTDDFSELLEEHSYYNDLDNVSVSTPWGEARYHIAASYDDLFTSPGQGDNVISVILSIEGANVLTENSSLPPDPVTLLRNVNRIKRWRQPPLFITFCHHFNNNLAGHARSLPGMLRLLLNQEEGLNDDLNPLGKSVIRRLLAGNPGKRIFIDVKHMSRLARLSYYEMLRTSYRNERVPVIVSHGALNGYPSIREGSQDQPERNGKFNGRDINFYDDEILTIKESDGIIGLQIDKRQVTNHATGKKINLIIGGRKRRRKWTELVWNQIGRIADILDSHGQFAWSIACLGTDFDGIVSPIDGYWTSGELTLLKQELRELADDYLMEKQFQIPANRIGSGEIIERFFSINAMEFFRKYYH